MMRCNNKKCRKRFSIFIGSIFENSKLKISEILRMIYCYAMKFTLEETILQSGIQKMAIVEWNKKLRNILVEKYNSLRLTKIGGINLTVEIDEAHLYSNRKRIGRKLVGQSYWIVGGICRETKDIFFDITTSRNANYMIRLIERNVEKRTRIITDCWRGYNKLCEYGYIHETVNHSIMFVTGENMYIQTILKECGET